MGKRRALLVCPESPYPMNGGGAMRTASILNYLSQGFDVDMVLFQEGAGPESDPIPRGLVQRVATLTLPRHSRRTTARFYRNLARLARGVVPLCDRFQGYHQSLAAWLNGNEYDLAVLEHFWVAPYQSLIRKHARRVVLDLHNIESVLLQRTAVSNFRVQSWALNRFAAISQKEESALLPCFDALLVTSQDDAERVSGAGVPVVVYPNSLPPAPLPDVAKEDTIAFSANWSYHPNQSGLRWFLDRVWPSLRSRLPGFQLLLIGRNNRDIQPLVSRTTGIRCTGSVEDALPWIAKAKVAIAPLLFGSGTRLKIVEAWAARVPVVATSIAAEGLAAQSGSDLMIEDSPEGFANAVVTLMESPETALRIAETGRRRFESSYSWPAAWESLSQAGF